MLARSAKPGRKGESVTNLLHPGTYYLKLTLTGATGTNCALSAAVARPTKRQLAAMGPGPGA